MQKVYKILTVQWQVMSLLIKSYSGYWAHQVTPAMSWRARMASIALAAASVFTTSAYPASASWQPSRLFPHPGWSTRTLPGGRCLHQEHKCIRLWLHVITAMVLSRATWVFVRAYTSVIMQDHDALPGTSHACKKLESHLSSTGSRTANSQYQSFSASMLKRCSLCAQQETSCLPNLPCRVALTERQAMLYLAQSRVQT